MRWSLVELGYRCSPSLMVHQGSPCLVLIGFVSNLGLIGFVSDLVGLNGDIGVIGLIISLILLWQMSSPVQSQGCRCPLSRQDSTGLPSLPDPV